MNVDKLNQNDQLQAASAHHTQKIAARPEYEKGKVHQVMFGSKYRELWITPVVVDVLHLENENLSIIKQGGGRQTLNLRVKDQEDNQYVLRSIDKNPASNLPQPIKNSFVGTLVKDQASSGHPYGALTVTKMSEALQIYHTNPQLKLIASDASLQSHDDQFAGMMVLMEHRPDDDQSEFDYLGNSKNVVSTRKMLNDLLKENDSKVGVDHFLKTRLFDMVIGDWSRHEDNWRWATYEQEKGTFYKAIPRDRDNIYYYLDGFIPNIIRLISKPQYRSFSHNISSFKGLNKSGETLDNLLLSSLSSEHWQKMADSIRMDLTDEIVEEAVRELPNEIYKKNGKWLAERIKNRRDELPEEIRRYYLQLARKPLLYGTDKHEKIIITSLDGDIQVEIFKIKKDGEVRKLLYKRRFFAKETKEIKIFALAGNDQFVFNSQDKSNIRVKVYGGAGEDDYLRKGRKHKKITIIESAKGGNTFDLTKGVRVREKRNPDARHFDANGALLEYYLWD